MARAPLPLTQIDEQLWRLDCLGMLCPVPVIKAGRAIRVVPAGALLEVLADDPGSELDLQDWCSANRHEFVAQAEAEGVWTTQIRRTR